MNLYGNTKKARLVLENMQSFEGKLIGYPHSSSGEVVFNTGMTGYPETISDPSYKGQIQCITYPLVGNYGVPVSKSDPRETLLESDKIHLHGIIISDYSVEYSHSTGIESLSSWLYANKVPGLYDIDTRMLTKTLRENGTMLGKIIVDDNDLEFYDPNTDNLVQQVSHKEIKTFGQEGKNVLLYDCGCKNSIITNLLDRGVKVTRVPWDFDFNKVDFDAVLFSNGPGNPEVYTSLIEKAKELIKTEKPILGICLGHQILSIAAGATTYKMPYGHRGQNQPVMEGQSNKCYITSQNHGFAVNDENLCEGWSTWFKNLNDNTNEGFRHKSKDILSVQFHPEAKPGPVDTTFIFDEFINAINKISKLTRS
ncbi:MAG: carbamoyl phosphate synthase small subunit [Bacteroidetes bacterium 4572_112]|nr:MAG: carbamoyl phosphate synthase small subunit [Bacteroidetes bacterium 4572_112]